MSEIQDVSSILLYIVSVTAITLANISLISSLVHTVGGFKRLFTGSRAARYMTFILLAAGDLVSALLGAFVLSEVAFNHPQNITGSALVYIAYVMPTVYGLGLLQLCFESLCFKRRGGDPKTSNNNKRNNTRPVYVLASLTVSFLPWMVGLPMSLALILFYPSANIADRFDLLTCMCSLFPVLIVLLSALLMKTCFPDDFPDQTPSDLDEAPSSCTRYTTSEICHHKPNHSPKNGPSTPEGTSPTRALLPGGSPLASSETANPGSNLCRLHTSKDNDLPKGSKTQSSASLEKRAHIYGSLCFTLCCLPFAVNFLVHQPEKNGEGCDSTRSCDIVSFITSWLLCFRGFIMPIVWLRAGSGSIPGL